MTVSTITILEIVKGFHKVHREEKLLQFLSTVTTAEILTLSIKSAEIAGRIYAELERTGQPIGRADPIVAAIALAAMIHIHIRIDENPCHPDA